MRRILEFVAFIIAITVIISVVIVGPAVLFATSCRMALDEQQAKLRDKINIWNPVQVTKILDTEYIVKTNNGESINVSKDPYINLRPQIGELWNLEVLEYRVYADYNFSKMIKEKKDD